jgi:hypothetical protein
MSNPTKKLEELIEKLVPGNQKAVGTVLLKHVGDKNYIRRPALLSQARAEVGGSHLTDRRMRQSIEYFRNMGIRICHKDIIIAKGEDKEIFQGYFIAETEAEYEAFRARYVNYACTIEDTARAMDRQRPNEKESEDKKRLANEYYQPKISKAI